jgi:hypothetical protein
MRVGRFRAGLRAVYDVISGSAGTRDRVRLRSLFDEGTGLIPIPISFEGTPANVMTPDDFTQTADAAIGKSAF